MAHSHQQRLVSTRLEYKDPFAGRAAEIAISYTPMEPISDGEVIKIVLQQFTGENGYVEVNSSSAFLYSASCEEFVFCPCSTRILTPPSSNRTNARYELLLTAKATPTSTPVRFSIKKERGIRLPVAGLIQNSLALTIAKGLSGAVYAFSSSPAVGSFIYDDFPTKL
eukprot:686344-Rhodomonas_salina.1